MQAKSMGHSDYIPERRLGLLDFLCLGWNCVIGSGIFLTQGEIARQVGSYGPVMFLIGGLCCLPIALCFAQLAQRFHGTGGSSLYAREAFGKRAGFLVGWVMWLSGLIGLSSVSVGLAAYLHQGPLVACSIVALLALVNLFGSRSGALSNNLLAIVKLGPLFLAALAGLAHPWQTLWPAAEPAGAPNYKLGLLLVLYTYSGFEEIVLAAGEAKDPARTVPRATVLVLLSSALVYTLLQGVAGPALAEHPLEAALPSLAGMLGVAAVASLASVNASIAFTTPRSLWTLAHQGWLSPRLLKLHNGAPSLCIVISSGLVMLLILSKNLEALIALSVLAALLQHLASSLACWKLRLGRLLPPLAVATCLLLLGTSSGRDLAGMGASLLLGVFISAMVRPSPPGPADGIGFCSED
ncbi:MAG: APC family permease [Vulcanimicrobiota bacterium]